MTDCIVQVHELAAEVSKGFFKDPRFATKKEVKYTLDLQ